jgi:glycosyltransferase involved in cell wall biosynthesis
VKVCLFDDVSGGHHTSYVSGLAAAALDQGENVLVAAPEPVEGLPDGLVDWLSVSTIPHREVLAGRRALRNVIHATRNWNIDMFLDLYLDRTIWRWPRHGAEPASTVHVLHHANQYAYGRGRSDFVARAARQRLTSFVRRGDGIAVHTDRARDILSSFLPLDRITRVGFPVRPPAAVPTITAVPSTSSRRRLIFVGQARAEKGAELLVSALQWLPQDVEIAFVGPQDPTQKALLQSYSKRITWIDRFVSDAEMTDELRSADLVVLPYLTGFGRHGGASGVLLTTLAHGRPLVLTSVLEPQLPHDYGGAVVVPPGNARALADGIQSGFDNLGELTHHAATAGPAFIREQHSFAGYLRSLLDAARDAD